MSNYLDSLPEEVKIRYQEKIKNLHKILHKLKDDESISFEPLTNISHTKTLFKYKFVYKLDDENMLEQSTPSIIDSVFIKSLDNINKCKVYKDINIKEILDKYNYIDYDNYIDNQISQYKYLVVGEQHIPFIDFVKKDGDNLYYYGKYNNIKIFVVDSLENMYLMNGPILDFNNVDVSYHDTLSSEIEDEEKFDFHKGIYILNFMLGDIEVIEINT